jgi:hypothetical protein
MRIDSSDTVIIENVHKEMLQVYILKALKNIVNHIPDVIKELE